MTIAGFDEAINKFERESRKGLFGDLTRLPKYHEVKMDCEIFVKEGVLVRLPDDKYYHKQLRLIVSVADIVKDLIDLKKNNLS